MGHSAVDVVRRSLQSLSLVLVLHRPAWACFHLGALQLHLLDLIVLRRSVECWSHLPALSGRVSKPLRLRAGHSAPTRLRAQSFLVLGHLSGWVF